MLILTRKQGEHITIGNDIRISILDVRGKSVRIGIEAPRSTIILREEIYQKIQQENQQAARGIKKENLHAIAQLIAEKRPEEEPA